MYPGCGFELSVAARQHGVAQRTEAESQECKQLFITHMHPVPALRLAYFACSGLAHQPACEERSAPRKSCLAWPEVGFAAGALLQQVFSSLTTWYSD
jgi:hypothetical protein